MKRPNLIFVFADQWRAQAFGYAGDTNAVTPNIDHFAEQSVNFRNAVSGCPVCCPYRVSLMTGQYPLTHGVFLNDVKPRLAGPFFAEALAGDGYDTAYIGKWHAGGGPRLEPTPPEYRAGFRFWRGLECTHNYNHSIYYTETGEKRLWDGYDAEAQTREAVDFIRAADRKNPFALFLSWAPPHEPYETAPERFKALFDADRLTLRPNVPPELQAEARKELAGYYAHGAALDACFGELLNCIGEAGIADDTIVVFTSDHGDMLRSHGLSFKQRPYDESVRVPFLIRWPAACAPAVRDEAIDAPDLMPTLLTLCGVETPSPVEGRDLSAAVLNGSVDPAAQDAYMLHIYPFGQCFGWNKGEWRGIRTARYSYIISHDGPWLLFDNDRDPYQLDNLVGTPEAAALQARLAARLDELMKAHGDEFLTGREYVERFGHRLDDRGNAPYFQWEKDRLEFIRKQEEK